MDSYFNNTTWTDLYGNGINVSVAKNVATVTVTPSVGNPSQGPYSGTEVDTMNAPVLNIDFEVYGLATGVLVSNETTPQVQWSNGGTWTFSSQG